MTTRTPVLTMLKPAILTLTLTASSPTTARTPMTRQQLLEHERVREGQLLGVQVARARVRDLQVATLRLLELVSSLHMDWQPWWTGSDYVVSIQSSRLSLCSQRCWQQRKRGVMIS